MELLRLSAGLFLPWVVGTLWLIVFESQRSQGAPPHPLRQIGYGFFLGYALLAPLVLAFDAWLNDASWGWIMSFMGVLAASGLIAMKVMTPSQRLALPAASPLGVGGKTLLVVLLIWTALHLLFVSVEVLSLPVYPWDAWQTWVYRAKAWLLSGGVTDIVSAEDWATAKSPSVYTAQAAGYPLLPSVIPYWAALSLGRWSETLVNVPALLAGIAIGMALYGQCRESGMSTLTGVLGCYLLFSIPLFTTHIALAGYADLWMAGFAGLGFIALLRGAATQDRWQLMLGLCMIALAIGVKNEGVVWFLAALFFLQLTTLPLRANLAVLLILTMGILFTQSLGFSHFEIPHLGALGVVNGRLEIPLVGSFALEARNVSRVYLDNFFMMGSWNLLWLLIAAALLLALSPWNSSANRAVQRSGGIFILVFLATQIFIFGFTDQGIWADTYTAINRLPLHFVPPLLYGALVIVRDRLEPAFDRRLKRAEHGHV
jgi:hypothetical protein